MRGGGAAGEELGDGSGACDVFRRTHLRGHAIGPHHDSGVEQGQEGGELPGTCCRQKRVDDHSLAAAIGAVRGTRSMQAAACAAGELPRGNGGTFHDRSDLVERHREHVVQNKGEALGGSQLVEYDQQRGSDRVGEQRFILGVGTRGAVCDRLGEAAWARCHC